jgi:hypothetical protein
LGKKASRGGSSSPPGHVQANGGSTGNGEVNQSPYDMSALKIKIDNEKFRKAIALLYYFGGCSILENG